MTWHTAELPKVCLQVTEGTGDFCTREIKVEAQGYTTEEARALLDHALRRAGELRKRA